MPQQILDLKHFVKNNTNQQIGIDKTFNYKNQRVVRKHSRVEPDEHPISLGPIMLQKDATYKTYQTYF